MTAQEFHTVREAYTRNVQQAEPSAPAEHVNTMVAACLLQYVAADADAVLFQVEPGRCVLPGQILHRAATHVISSSIF